VSAESLALAKRKLDAGDVAGARAACERVLEGVRSDRDALAARLLLSACAQRERDYAGALEHITNAESLAPQDALVAYARADVLDAAGAKPAAIAALRRAIELDPRMVRAHHLLGILLGEAGDVDGALSAFEQTVRLDPAHVRAWNNLGNTLRNVNRLGEAENAFSRAVALDAGYGLAVTNLASVLRDQAKAAQAESVLRAFLERSQGKPFRPALLLLAGILRERSEYDEAAAYFSRAIELAPGESESEWVQLGWIRIEQGDRDGARAAYRESSRGAKANVQGVIGERLALPLIYSGATELESIRGEYASGLADLEQRAADLTRGRKPDEVLDALRWSNFFLAYQGRDDRALQEAYARFVSKAIDTVAPQWRHPVERRRPPGARVRVGFASSFLRDGTVGRYFRDWITLLDRERFEVYVYHMFPGIDGVSGAAQKRADVFRVFGGSRSKPSIVAAAIRDDALDVLVYPELGMDVTSFALASLRLAPRQYAAWGHPVTTGYDTIDGFFTAAAMEPADASAHYHEPLIPLPGIGTSYARPRIPGASSRERLGSPEGPLFLCPQSMFKIHPDNDALFARVLAANPSARLVLFAWRYPPVTRQFLRRLSAVLAQHGVDADARLVVLPAMAHEDYLRVNLACDAMLDTLHWSGGNTSLDALAVGLPIVTLPGAFMRGRQSAAMLRLMGEDALVAADEDAYVAIATRLIADDGWRDARRQAIRDAAPRIFGDATPISRIADVLAGE
jgi:CRISPR-associated protein Csy1